MNSTMFFVVVPTTIPIFTTVFPVIKGRPNLFMFDLITNIFGSEPEGGERRGGPCNRNLTEL